MEAIRLSEAMFCFNCDSIFKLSENPCNSCCPVCTSSTYSRLDKILNREDTDVKTTP